MMKLPRNLVRVCTRRWRAAAMLVAIATAALIGTTGAGKGLERTLRDLAWSLRDRPASGQVHIVEIDARSIGAIDRWPWPRSNYALLVDRLREAGAASIAFDVDFSSHSDRQEDAAFARALARAGGKVVLPTFRQVAGGGQRGWRDSLPVPALRAHANLAAVSILPDGDGYVRRAPIGTITAGVPRPSLAAITANAEGSADTDFAIDFSIDPATIPRHSFIDVRDGRFDSAAIAGRDVLIGATAVEMGDRYAVPRHGVIPGVVIQALAAETLARGVPREGGWVVPLLLAAAFAAAILAARSRAALTIACVAAPIALFAATAAADALAMRIFLLVPALACTTMAACFAFAMRWVAAVQRGRARDGETGLPNRRALRHAMLSGDRLRVVAARIADFDKIAAGLGEAGTAELVRRVRDRVATATAGAPVYRIEDRVLAWRTDLEQDLDSRLKGLRSLMLGPIEVAGRRVDVSLTFGIAHENETAEGERAIAHAALAADRALSEGRPWHVHASSEDEAVDRELSLMGELDEAIDRGEIQVVYQPKLDLREDRLASVEALVRWNHPRRGFLAPDLFIPLAERNDRVDGLTLHVVAQTLRDLADWQAHGHRVTAAINISAKLLSDSGFLSALRALVAESGMSPAALTFEVTESAAMTDPAGAAAALAAFRELGVAISMDDYGTGQSTLSYIKQLPLDELKIDRSFVQFAHQNRGDGALVRSTIDLAHELGLKVVAEGVEDQACLEFLRAVGCDFAQGYLISKPIAPSQFAALLASDQTRAA